MLQRYLNMSTRLAALRATVNAAVLDDGGDNANGNSSANCGTSGEATVTASNDDDVPARGGGATGDAGGGAAPSESRGAGTSGDTTTINNSGSNSTKTNAAAMVPGGGTILMAQLRMAEGIMSRELEGLSEGDLLLISERCAQ